LEFLGKKWEFPWNWKAKWLWLQPIAFQQNSDFPLGIRRNPQEFMEEGKDLDASNITFNQTIAKKL
jgi:hypothetical protein